jgi:hypothetical protein
MSPTNIYSLYSLVMWSHWRIYSVRADVVRPPIGRFRNCTFRFSCVWTGRHFKRFKVFCVAAARCSRHHRHHSLPGRNRRTSQPRPPHSTPRLHQPLSRCPSDYHLTFGAWRCSDLCLASSASALDASGPIPRLKALFLPVSAGPLPWPKALSLSASTDFSSKKKVFF